MSKIIALSLIAVGVILAFYGMKSSGSMSSSISQLFSGSPTNKTLWFLIGGTAAVAIGITGLVRGSNLR